MFTENRFGVSCFGFVLDIRSHLLRLIASQELPGESLSPKKLITIPQTGSRAHGDTKRDLCF